MDAQMVRESAESDPGERGEIATQIAKSRAERGIVVEECQGWANAATWAAALWLGNDEPLYRAAVRACGRAGNPRAAADALHRVFTQQAPEMARKEVRQNGGMRQVDWYEIADGWES